MQTKRSERNLPTGVKLVRTLRGQVGEIYRITWSPDGRVLVSSSDDMTIRMWDAETGKCLNTLKGHNVDVTCIAFDPAAP